MDLPLNMLATKAVPDRWAVPSGWYPLGVFVASFFVYFYTLAPTVYRLDSAELSAAAYNLGVPHATGYPLYLLLGKVFTLLPVGDVGYRLNLMSAIFAAGSVTVVYLLASLVSRRAVLSLVIAGSLGFSYYFWVSAVAAEVYSLHAFLTATTIYLLLLWQRSSDNRLLYAAGFVWGMSFGNHLSTVLLGPGFAYLLASAVWRGQIKVRNLAILAVCFAPPLATYAYLPLRYLSEAVPYVVAHYDNQGELIRVDHTTFQGIWQTLTARQFGSLIFAYGPMETLGQLKQVAWWLFANFLGIGAVLGLTGILSSIAAHRQRFTFLALVFAANVLFFASYGATDKEFMLLPVYIVWAVWMAEGAGHFLDTVERRLPGASPTEVPGRLYKVLIRTPWARLALLLPVAALIVNFPYVDLSSDTHVRDRAERVLASMPPNALILARWADEAPMNYLQIVEDRRPDLQIIDRFLISREDERQLIERSLSLRPVYVFGPLPALSFPFKTVPLEGGAEAGHRLIAPNQIVTD